MSPRQAVAVVTGGVSGLGRAFVRALRREGVHVIVADVHAPSDEDASLEGVSWVQLDVRQPESHQRLLEMAVAAGGQCDLWINNAGVAVAGQVGQTPVEDWTWVLDINLRGVIWGSHTVMPHFRTQGRGILINVASAAGLLCGGHMGAYNVSKAGVVALSETLYQETRGTHIGVTVACPTFFETNLLSTARAPNMGVFGLARRAMKQSGVQADDVAARVLRDARRGRLYSLPMRDGWTLWQVKRWMPQRFHDLFAWFVRRRTRSASSGRD